MAKKTSGTKKPSVEILDDNGTLIAAGAGAAGAGARGSGEGEAPPDRRDVAKP